MLDFHRRLPDHGYGHRTRAAHLLRGGSSGATDWKLRSTEAYAPACAALGVQVDVVEFDASVVTFGNTKKRISDR